MVIGIACQFGAPGIDHDQRFSFHGLLLDLGAGNRVCICRVGADDHHAIGILKVFDRIGGGTGAEGTLHADGGG